MPRSDGWFKPGRSGNPGGRPRDHGKAAEQARQFAVHAIYSLVQQTCSQQNHARDRRAAAKLLIRLGFGPNAGAGDAIIKQLGWQNVRRQLEISAEADAARNGAVARQRLTGHLAEQSAHGYPHHREL